MPALNTLPISPTGNSRSAASPVCSTTTRICAASSSAPRAVELARDRVAVLSELACDRGEGGYLGLGERARVDERGQRLDGGHVEVVDDCRRQCGRRARAVAVDERGVDRFAAQPVAAALVAQQMAPTTDAPGAPVGANAEHVGAGAGDRAHAWAPAGCRSPCADDVVDDRPFVAARRAHPAGDGVGVGAGHGDDRGGELAALYARSAQRLVGDFEQGLDGRVGADGVLIARAAGGEVHGAVVEVEHRRECLRGATVQPHHVASVGMPG